METDRVRRNFLCSSCIIATWAIFPFATRAMPVSISHSGINGVLQGNANLCWLASVAMLMSWKNKSPISMSSMATTLGDPFEKLFKQSQSDSTGGGLPITDVKLLADKLGLKTSGLASFNTSWWVDTLKKGPMMIAGYVKNPARMGHAVVLSGIDGDTNDVNRMGAEVYDPNYGAKIDKDFRQTIAFYEGLADPAVDAQAPQILHF